MPERRPESDLEVLWQRHVPEGFAASLPHKRAHALTQLARDVDFALHRFGQELEHGDLVVTIARRPTQGRTPRRTRPMGDTQRAVLRTLRQHGDWYAGCGWTWTTDRVTERILASLVRRGEVSTTTDAAGRTVYLAVPPSHRLPQ